MALQITHAFVSGKADGADATLVRPSNWNANHTITGAGDAATKNTGTTAGTLAAGDDSRITGAAQKSANLSDIASPATAFANIKQAGTSGATGALQLATNAEAITGTDTAKAVTAAGVKAAIGAQVVYTAPSASIILSGTGATYTTPAGALYLHVRMCGGGAGGGAQNTNNGTAGNATSFSDWAANGGSPGVHNGAGGAGGTGGADGTGTKLCRMTGGDGGAGSGQAPAGFVINGGIGGFTPFFGGGALTSTVAPAAGGNAKTNSGGGGAGGGYGGTGATAGGGGGSGEYVEFIIPTPSATYTYTVGANASGGSAGTLAGGTGAAGRIEVVAHFQ